MPHASPPTRPPTRSPTDAAIGAFLVVGAVFALAACGSVKHASRGTPSPKPGDPTFVEVRTTGFDGPHAVVSFSTWDVAVTDDLPPTIPDGVLAEMRDEAAHHGAELLLLERIEDAFRKVWLGLGAKRVTEGGESPVAVCTHPGFAEALADARSRGESCVKRLLFERPALAGQVDVLFEVDPNGRVLRAAPTPDSSRDGQLQQCVVGAVHRTVFGVPEAFTCKGRVDVDTAGFR